MGFLAWLHPSWGVGDRSFTAGHPLGEQGCEEELLLHAADFEAGFV